MDSECRNRVRTTLTPLFLLLPTWVIVIESAWVGMNTFLLMYM